MSFKVIQEPPEIKSAEGILFSNSDHAIDIELGTKPHYVPLEPLKAWSRIVLGDEDAAYPVQQKIAREGTEAQPVMRPAILENVFRISAILSKELNKPKPNMRLAMDTVMLGVLSIAQSKVVVYTHQLQLSFKKEVI